MFWLTGVFFLVFCFLEWKRDGNDTPNASCCGDSFGFFDGSWSGFIRVFVSRDYGLWSGSDDSWFECIDAEDMMVPNTTADHLLLSP